MKTIILNSGIGSRLGVHTKDKPKCMVKIKDDMTILENQLRLLEAAGIKDIIITTGYMNKVLEEHAEAIRGLLKISYVYNADYKATNYINSLDLTEDIDDDILLMHGDLIFEPYVLEKVLQYDRSCMVIDKSRILPEKDFKARLEGDKITEIGVHITGPDCAAAQPLYKLMKNDWAVWKKSIRDFCKRGNVKVYAEDAFNAVSEQLDVRGLSLDGRLCSEIDNEEDLNSIRKQLMEV